MHCADVLAGRESGRGRPRTAYLRRATSTAYYALFHELVTHGANRVLPRGPRQDRLVVARWFGHGDSYVITPQLRGGLRRGTRPDWLRAGRAALQGQLAARLVRLWPEPLHGGAERLARRHPGRAALRRRHGHVPPDLSVCEHRWPPVATHTREDPLPSRSRTAVSEAGPSLAPWGDHGIGRRPPRGGRG